MSRYSEMIAELSAEQRALLEVQLQRKRKANHQTRPGQPAAERAALPANRDDENLVLSRSKSSVEDLLGQFYGRFPWPWQPMSFNYLTDPDFGAAMLNQDLGDWEHRTVPADASIWVAGCGTNQALLTAMRFPKARVIGSDVSVKSLEVCAENASQMGVSNLELRQEGISQAGYAEQFDYVICTGVIHHNSDPRATLAHLGAALKPAGIMELMVYNRFHRAMTSGFQKAIRIFGEERGEIDFESDLATAKRIADSYPPVDSQLAAFLKQTRDSPESDFADLLIQPVEHSYTVESLEEMAESCGLRYVQPCATLYAKYRWPTISWNMAFGDPALQSSYEALPDSRRWQITNLLLQEKSSLLWFYLQRQDSGRRRKTEQEICAEFLDRPFARASTKQRSYIRGNDGRYRPSPDIVSFPAVAPIESTKEILDAIGETGTPREALRRLRIEPRFTTVNHARVHLATSAFPYLKAIPE